MPTHSDLLAQTVAGLDCIRKAKQLTIRPLFSPYTSSAHLEKFVCGLLEPHLNSDPSDTSICITTKLNAPGLKTRLSEILFESFSFARLQFTDPLTDALFASGRTTGLVLDLGHSSCAVKPVVDGYPQEHAGRLAQFGGTH